MQRKTCDIEFYKNNDGDLFLIKDLECFKKCYFSEFWQYQCTFKTKNDKIEHMELFLSTRPITKLERMALELEGVINDSLF